MAHRPLCGAGNPLRWLVDSILDAVSASASMSAELPAASVGYCEARAHRCCSTARHELCPRRRAFVTDS